MQMSPESMLSLKWYCLLGKQLIQLTCEQWSSKTWQDPSTSIVSMMGTPIFLPSFCVHKLVVINFKIECCGPVIILMSSPSKSMPSQSQHMAPSQCILMCNSFIFNKDSEDFLLFNSVGYSLQGYEAQRHVKAFEQISSAPIPTAGLPT